jgi:DNA-binding transcriptional MerR regulator
MGQETWTSAELFEGVDVSPPFVGELEKLGLLHVVAQDYQGRSIYGAEAKEQLEKVLGLVELGYQPRDIAAIAQKVGLPSSKRSRFRKPPTYLRLEELSAQSGVRLEQIQEWCGKGIVKSSTETDGGVPLFGIEAVEVARALKDLLAFGLNQDQLSEWSELGRAVDKLITGLHKKAASGENADKDDVKIQVARASEMIESLRKRLDGLRGGIRRWDKLLGAYDKRLDRLRKVWTLESRKPRGKRRIRVPTRRRRL